MNKAILVEAGLTESQSETYIKLVENSPISPPALAKLTGETRSNTYKILEQLEEIGLAQADESEKKIKYWAKHPSELLAKVEDEVNEANLRRTKLVSNMPQLIRDYVEHSEQPAVRFFSGKEGIKEVYRHTLHVCEDIYVIRSPKDEEFMSAPFYESYQRDRASAGIKTHILSSNKKVSSDAALHKVRTYLPEKMYNAPVEISVYGDYVAIISFGSEAVATVLESSQVAAAMRQLYLLAQQAAHAAAPD